MPQVFALLIGPVGMKVAFIGLMTGSYLLIGLYALVLSAWAAHPVTKGLGSGA
ncbi:hypothetical protein RAA17_09750 [Komagataeibacter rhaeticus]|nr:hypothetical protein [Komagataeibacter rhaeticus]